MGRVLPFPHPTRQGTRPHLHPQGAPSPRKFCANFATLSLAQNVSYPPRWGLRPPDPCAEEVNPPRRSRAYTRARPHPNVVDGSSTAGTRALVSRTQGTPIRRSGYLSCVPANFAPHDGLLWKNLPRFFQSCAVGATPHTPEWGAPSPPHPRLFNSL